jgi:hypothetical protein
MKKLTAYPAVRTLLLVPPMFVPGRGENSLLALSRAGVKEQLNTKLTKDTKSNK